MGMKIHVCSSAVCENFIFQFIACQAKMHTDAKLNILSAELLNTTVSCEASGAWVSLTF